MSSILRRDPKTMVPDLIDWFEAPFVTLRRWTAYDAAGRGVSWGSSL